MFAVPRPKIISDYFEESNNIDSHNQLRQAELRLEKCVLTNNCWLRIWTTLVGMTVTDALRSLKFVGKKTRNDYAHMSINKFTNRLAYECLHNNFDEEASCNLPPIIRLAKLSASAVTMDGITQVSSISGNSNTPVCHIDKNGVEHFMGILETARRRYCRICYRDHKKRQNSKLICLTCNEAFCMYKTRTKRDCWMRHIRECVVVETK